MGLDTAVPVYDLTVDTDHCYYANGVLVSNCSYGASLLFPLGKWNAKTGKRGAVNQGGYYDTSPGSATVVQGRPGAKLPPGAKTIGS